ncbi:YceI family protein [uncultured Algibacter sp.]|uniref:YceI family protein n=1 Tax=uncultured Algibacter sp. TaxID=298659 RepID=UPI003216920A
MKSSSIKYIVFISFLLGSLINSGAQNKSKIDFAIHNLGIQVDGHFNAFNIKAAFNSKDELTSVYGSITVNSIKTGIDSRDKHLLKEDYFDATQHKNILLNSQSIIKNTDNTYTVKVSLKIKGKSQVLTIPINVVKKDDVCKLISNFQINRRDFKIGGGSLILSKTVKINVVHFQKL